MKYEIGQEVWRASFDSADAYVVCPDCGGTARVRVMLPDDTIVSIECEGCRHGYSGSDGRIHVYDRRPVARLVNILGLEMRDGKTEWQTSDSYRVGEEDLFDTEVEAMTRARAIAADHDREERDRVNRKEKPLKSWAWHAHYHRSCIKEAERQIAYHTARLNVAKVKAKEKADAA